MTDKVMGLSNLPSSLNFANKRKLEDKRLFPDQSDSLLWEWKHHKLVGGKSERQAGSVLSTCCFQTQSANHPSCLLACR